MPSLPHDGKNNVTQLFIHFTCLILTCIVGIVAGRVEQQEEINNDQHDHHKHEECPVTGNLHDVLPPFASLSFLVLDFSRRCDCFVSTVFAMLTFLPTIEGHSKSASEEYSGANKLLPLSQAYISSCVHYYYHFQF